MTIRVLCRELSVLRIGSSPASTSPNPPCYGPHIMTASRGVFGSTNAARSLLAPYMFNCRALLLALQTTIMATDMTIACVVSIVHLLGVDMDPLPG